ncbi:MAG: quinone oxidoreductase [Candidatus Liptonbacteria bacterium]|nr:quinone oxidoreductase [Candidatus Liptonbacteria bacterium]
MNAVRIHKYGGVDVLKMEEVKPRPPERGEALVRVEAAGVSFGDIYHRRGSYAFELPSTLGHEGAGIVEAVGPDVREVKTGDKVAWTCVWGSYATHLVAPAERLVIIPEGVEVRDAAAVMTHGLTAHALAHSICSIVAGDVCLVHAAAGGTGQLLCQMLKLLGAKVIGTVSNDVKARIAREAGADEVVIYTKNDFAKEVMRLTDGEGARVVFDSVGKDTIEKSMQCLALRGHLVLYGQSSGAPPSVDPAALREKSLSVTRPVLPHYIASREELLFRAGEVFHWLASGAVRLRIDATYPLEEAAAAHTLLECRKSAGKILLLP